MDVTSTLKFQKKDQELEAEEATAGVKDEATVKMLALVDQKRNQGDPEILTGLRSFNDASLCSQARIEVISSSFDLYQALR